jgi:hypothetical protein
VTYQSESDRPDNVVPLPPRQATEAWTFTSEVNYADGVEGEWLRRELAGALRELLIWARDDNEDRAA